METIVKDSPAESAPIKEKRKYNIVQTIRHKRIAKEILKSPTRKEAMLNSGYALSYANTGHILQKQGFIKAVEPILERYKREEQRLLNAMDAKNLDKEQYRTQIDAIDKVRKQIQLLSGSATENVALQITGMRIIKE
jgi:hypothetical protein